MTVELIASMDQALCLLLFNSGDEFRLRDFKKATAIGKCHLEPARKVCEMCQSFPARTSIKACYYCSSDFLLIE